MWWFGLRWVCGWRWFGTRPSGRRGGPCPSGRRLGVIAGRRCVRCRVLTHPSGRRLFRSRQGLGSLPGAHPIEARHMGGTHQNPGLTDRWNTTPRRNTTVPPWLRHASPTTGATHSPQTRGHHGTHQRDTQEDPPSAATHAPRPQHPLATDDLPRPKPPPPPWERYTPTTHRHPPPASATGGRHHARNTTTHRPADPTDAAARARRTDSAPHAPESADRWTITPRRPATTPPWLRHSNPTHPTPGDPEPHATGIPHGPRTEEHRGEHQANTRDGPTPQDDQTRAATHPTWAPHPIPADDPARTATESRHGTPPPPWESEHTTQHHHTTPNPLPPPLTRTSPGRPPARDTTTHQPGDPMDMGPHSPPTQGHHRSRHHTAHTPHRGTYPRGPRTPHTDQEPTAGHSPNHNRKRIHRPRRPPANDHAPQPCQATRSTTNRHRTPHQPPHTARTPAWHTRHTTRQHPDTQPPTMTPWPWTSTAYWSWSSNTRSCDPHRAGPHEAPMRPLQHKCPTLRGDKEEKERRQTITCERFHPNTGYLFHLMYAYITQGRPDAGLLCLTPRAQTIITGGIGVYATPLLQPTQTTTRTTQGNPVYIYHPTTIARLPVPSDTNIIFFTDASGTQQRTPTVSCACIRVTRRADGLHVERHTGATIFGASSHGELRTLADTVNTTPPSTKT